MNSKTPDSYAEGPGPAAVFVILADPCSVLSSPHLKAFNLSDLTEVLQQAPSLDQFPSLGVGYMALAEEAA